MQATVEETKSDVKTMQQIQMEQTILLREIKAELKKDEGP
jgi:hypothetical protein